MSINHKRNMQNGAQGVHQKYIYLYMYTHVSQNGTELQCCARMMLGC